MQQEDFVNAKNNEQAQRALFAWVNSRNIDFATGETFVPSEKYNNFALALAISLKTENQSTIQKRLNKIFDLIQGTQEENLFEKPDNTPKTKEEAIKEIFNIDYNGRKGSTILESNSRNSQRWGRGSNGNPSSKEQTQSGNGTSDNRGRTSTNAEQVTELTPEEKSKKAFEAVRKAVEKAGLVIHEATPEMVAEAKEKSGLEFMGTRVDNRMSDIEQHFSNKTLTEEQRNIVEVFTGKRDNVSIKLKSIDGITRTIMFRQGNENKSGIKHILFRHYNTQSSPINADDVLLIPHIIENGVRTETKKGGKKSIDYKFTDTNGVDYILVTEFDNRKENISTYYKNYRGNIPTRPNTQLRAQAGNTTSSASKGTTNNSNNLKIFEKKSDGTIYGWFENGEIYLTPEGLNSETLIHEYTHLWVQCVKKLHPKKWDEIKNTLKSCKELWDSVVNDTNYSNIKGDEDAIASEVLSRYSGKDGEQRMLDALDNADKKDVKSIISKAKQAIKDFWNEVVKLFGLDTKSFSKFYRCLLRFNATRRFCKCKKIMSKHKERYLLGQIQEILILQQAKLMDATYWGKNFGVLLIVDAYRKRLLWRKFLDKKETITDYLEGIEWLREHKFKILGIVCDGLWGLPQALRLYKVQYCQFHQVKTVDEYLTKNPQTDAGKELQKIAHLLCHTDKESFVGMLDQWYEKWNEWLKHRTLDKNTGRKIYTHRRVRSAYFSLKPHMKWLWTFYDYPDVPIPNTNNTLEAINTDLKTKLRVHNGMSRRYRRLFIDEYFRLKWK